jgi:hypothetical protein
MLVKLSPGKQFRTKGTKLWASFHIGEKVWVTDACCPRVNCFLYKSLRIWHKLKKQKKQLRTLWTTHNRNFSCWIVQRSRNLDDFFQLIPCKNVKFLAVPRSRCSAILDWSEFYLLAKWKGRYVRQRTGSVSGWRMNGENSPYSTVHPPSNQTWQDSNLKGLYQESGIG